MLDGGAGLADDPADAGRVAEEAERGVAGRDGEGRRRGPEALGGAVGGGEEARAGVGHRC